MRSEECRVWLVTIGEPLPTDGSGDRLLRTGQLARALQSAGHSVIWWTSDFNHHHKQMRKGPAVVDVAERYSLRRLRARGYTRNISLGRILDHRKLAGQFALAASAESSPDIIVASYPAIELALEAVRYGDRTNVPVFLDLRDQWPDVFLRAVPRPFHQIANCALSPFRRDARRALAGARGLVGITDSFLDWGLRFAGRERRQTDIVIPLAYDAFTPSSHAVAAAERYWDGLGVGADGSARRRLVFIGTLGRQVRFAALFRTVRDLESAGVEIVVCGDGEAMPEVARQAAGAPNIRIVGWQGRETLGILLQRSAAGVLPYSADPDFVASVPNKVSEYLSVGMPVLSSLPGETARLLDRSKSGITVDGSDPASWRGAIEHALLDRSVATEMGAAAKVEFAENLNADVVMRRYVDFVVRNSNIRSPSGRDAAIV